MDPGYQKFWQLARKLQSSIAPETTDRECHLANLPMELVIQILQCLAAPDVLLCKRVNLRFRDIINVSAELQHKIKCYVAHVIDGPRSNQDITERMSRVSRWIDAWKTLQIKDDPLVLQLDEMPWSYRSGSVFSCLTPSRRGISFHQLPSKQREIPYKHWTITNLAYGPIFICHDYTQELVVAAENTLDDFGRCARLHLLHDKTGQRHPAAPSRYLQMPKPVTSVSTEDHDLHIFGDLLGLIVRVEEDLPNGGAVIRSHTLVFNWKTGVLLKHLTGDLLSHEIVFVDDRHFVVPITLRNGHIGTYLAIVDCYRRTDQESDEVTTRGTLRQVTLEHASLLLQLPQVKAGSPVDYRVVHSMSSTGTQAGRLQPAGAPFYVDYTKRLFVLNMFIGKPWDAENWTKSTLLIPAPAILSRILRAPASGAMGECVMLPWSVWGQDARFMEEPMEDICGTRYLTSTHIDTEGGRKRFCTVYDFTSIPALLEDVREGRTGNGAMPYGVPDPAPVPVPEVGELLDSQGILTAAPCRRTVTNIELPNDRIVRLYEDGLLVYGPDNDSEVHVYAV